MRNQNGGRCGEVGRGINTECLMELIGRPSINGVEE